MKKIKKSFVAIIASLTVLSNSLFANEKPITLVVHHLHSPKAPTHTKFLLPWAEKVEKMSKGKIKVEVFPSMTLGGKPNELYKQARDGVVDIVWTVAGYTPGVFSRTEVFELPTVHKGSSLDTSVAIKENFDLIKDDFKKTKPLMVYVHAGNAIHSVNKKITSISDLKGLKLRTPSRTGGWLIEEFGAEPVGMPLPALPQALSKNAVDGALIPYEVFPPFKFHQLTKYSTEGKNGSRFGTSVFLLLMNKDKFNSLPKELQGVLEKSLNLDMVKEVGQLWMDVEKPGIKMQKNSKDSEIITLDDKAVDEFNEAGQRVVEKWIKEVSQKGIDGKMLVDKAREAINKNTK
ncbi:MAG: C4-dicarboxylate ABC transporter substrate-binding protein [Arcobacter sp.]|nr:MAG: C4-dicarboxylate ABC transporter substrate-binding protein [Arcobacter sp.]